MKYITLNKEEKQILKNFNGGKLVAVGTKKDTARYQSYAAATLQKARNINVRVTEKDLQKIKAKAMEKGIPYQTLITSLIHQYTHDKIKPEI